MQTTLLQPYFILFKSLLHMKNFSAQTILDVTPKFEHENVQISIRSWISASPMSLLAGKRQLENRQNAMSEAHSA